MGGGRRERESYKAESGEPCECLGRTIKGGRCSGLNDCLSFRPDSIRLHTPMANSVSSNRRHSPSLVGHQIAHPLKRAVTYLLPCIFPLFALVGAANKLQTSSSMSVHRARHQRSGGTTRGPVFDGSALAICHFDPVGPYPARPVLPDVHRSHGINVAPTVPSDRRRWPSAFPRQKFYIRKHDRR